MRRHSTLLGGLRVGRWCCVHPTPASALSAITAECTARSGRGQCAPRFSPAPSRPSARTITPNYNPRPSCAPRPHRPALPLCVSCHRWRVPSAKLGLELLHDQEDDHHSRHDAAKVRPEAIVQRHGALLRVRVRVRVALYSVMGPCLGLGLGLGSHCTATWGPA